MSLEVVFFEHRELSVESSTAVRKLLSPVACVITELLCLGIAEMVQLPSSTFQLPSIRLNVPTNEDEKILIKGSWRVQMIIKELSPKSQ